MTPSQLILQIRPALAKGLVKVAEPGNCVKLKPLYSEIQILSLTKCL